MCADNRREMYEHAIMAIDNHIKISSDGTFMVTADSNELDIDPVIFADLIRSIEETNNKIRLGEIDINNIFRPTFQEYPFE